MQEQNRPVLASEDSREAALVPRCGIECGLGRLLCPVAWGPRESESFGERVLGRAPSAALMHLVKRAELSKEEIQELRRILRDKEK